MEAVISGRIVVKDPKEKIFCKRLSVFQLAENPGSVCETCRRSGGDRVFSEVINIQR